PPENCISALPRDLRDPAAETLPPCAWRDRLRPPEATPPNSSNLCFPTTPLSATQWCFRGAHPKGCVPCRFQSSSGRRARNPAGVATVHDPGRPDLHAILQADRKETLPALRRAILRR